MPVTITALALAIAQPIGSAASAPPEPIDELGGPAETIRAVAFSPDGTKVVGGSFDGTAWLWGLEPGTVKTVTFGGHVSSIRSVKFSPDGEFVLIGDGGTARLWNAQSGLPVREFDVGTLDGFSSRPVFAVDFSPDGSRILSANTDGIATVWDFETGTPIHHLKGHPAPVDAAVFSPDGQKILTGGRDANIRLWDADSGHPIRSFEHHSGNVNSLAFSPDGTRFASASSDDTVMVWHLESRHPLLVLSGHTDTVESVDFSPNGEKIVSAGRDNTLQFWDSTSGENLLSVNDSGFFGNRWVASVAFSPDGTQVAVGSSDNSLRIRDAENGEIIRQYRRPTAALKSASFSPDGDKLLIGGVGIATLWDLERREIERDIPVQGGTQWASAAFSPDGTKYLTGNDGNLILWDYASGTQIRGFSGGGHMSGIRHVAFSRDGERILACEGSGTWSSTRVWDAKTGAFLQRFWEHEQFVPAAEFLPDSDHVISVSWDGTMKLWSIATGEELRSFTNPTGQIRSMALSPDAESILLGNFNGTAILLDADSWEIVRSFEGHDSRVDSVSFSPDGTIVLTGSQDRLAKLWHKETGTLLRTYAGHSGSVHATAFAPDGRTFASIDGSHSDRMVRIWSTDLLDHPHKLEIDTAFAGKTHSFSITLTNHDREAIRVESITFPRWLSGDWNSGLIEPGEDQVIHLTLEALSDGFYEEKIVIRREGDHPGNSVLIHGLIQPEPVRTLELSGEMNFGRVPVGKESSRLLWIANTGNLPLEIDEFDLPSGFSANWEPMVLAPGQSRELIITFQPDHPGFLVGTITARASDHAVSDSIQASAESVSYLLKHRLPAHPSGISAIGPTFNGSTLLAGGNDGVVKIWDWLSRDLLGQIEGHSGRIHSIDLSPNGQMVLTGASDGSARLWNLQTHSQLREFRATHHPVHSAVFSQDGSVVLTGSADGRLRFWEIESGELIKTINGPGPIAAAAIAPDGKSVAAAVTNGVWIWDYATGDLLIRLPGHGGAVSSLAFSPDGTRVVTGSPDGTLRLWNATSETAIQVLVTGYPVGGISISPNGQWVLAASTTGIANLYRLTDLLEWRRIFTDETGTAVSVAFTEDGSHALTGADDGTMRIWELAPALSQGILDLSLTPDDLPPVVVGGTASSDLTISNIGNEILHVESIQLPPAFSTDGVPGPINPGESLHLPVIFSPQTTGSYGGSVVVESDNAMGDNAAPISATAVPVFRALEITTPELRYGRVSTGLPESLYLAIHNSGNVTVTVDSLILPDGFTTEWEGGEIPPDETLEIPVVFAPAVTGQFDATGLVVSDADFGRSLFYLFGEGVENAPLWSLSGHSGTVESVAFSTDGRFLLSGARDWHAVLWDAKTGDRLRNFRHRSVVYSAQFSPDGTLAVTGTRANHATIWDLSTGERLLDLTDADRWVSATAFSPDGKTVLTGGQDQIARIWDAQTGALVQSFTGHTDMIHAVAYSSCGSAIVTGGADRRTFVWDVESGEIIQSFAGHLVDIRSVAFSPDGSHIVTTGTDVPDRTIRLWNVDSGQQIRSFGDGVIGAWAAAFSPDGLYFLTGGRDNTARIWNPDTGQEFQKFEDHFNDVLAVDFSPDGTRAVTSGGRWLYLWDTRLEPFPFTSLDVGGDMDFGDVVLGDTSNRVLLIENTGTTDVTIETLELPEGLSAVWQPHTLAPGEATGITVTFAPGERKTYQGEIVLRAEGFAFDYFLPFAGVGTEREIDHSGELDFGEIPEWTDAERVLLLEADGGAPVNVFEIQVPEGFSVDWEEGVITPGQTRPVTVRFFPTEPRDYSGELTVVSDASHGVVRVDLLGEGLAAEREIELAGDLDFGQVIVGATSERPVFIRNNGTGGLAVHAVNLPPGFTGDWTAGVIPPGGERLVNILFEPDGQQVYAGEVTVESNATSGQSVLAVSGEGVPEPVRIIQISGDVDFGKVLVGETAFSTITVGNAGQDPLQVMGSSSPQGFSIIWDNRLIPPGGSVEATLRFAPTHYRDFQSPLTIHSNATSGTNNFVASGTGISKYLIRTLRGHSGPVNAVAFSQDGSMALSGAGWPDNRAKLWEVETGLVLLTFGGHTGPIHEVGFLAGDSRIFTASHDGTVRLWNVESGEATRIFSQPDPVLAAAFFPNGFDFLTGAGLLDHTPRMWNLVSEHGNPIATIHTDSVLSVAVSPNGHEFLTGGRDQKAILWEGNTLSPQQVFEDVGGSVRGVAFTPDGTAVLTATTAGVTQMWDTADQKMLLELQGHGGAVNSVEFSMDEWKILTGSSDSTAAVWHPVTAEIVRRFRGHAGSVKAASFSPDATLAITGSTDTTAKLWRVMVGSPETFGEWIMDIDDPGKRSPDDAPFPDGVSNLARYALGLAAGELVSGGTIQPGLLSDGHFEAAFIRHAWRDDVFIEVEASHDLVTWRSIATANGTDRLRPNPSETGLTITDTLREDSSIRDVWMRFNQTESSQLFMRFKVHLRDD